TSAAENLFAQGGAINDEREGATHARVVERSLGGVEGEGVGGEGRLLAEKVRPVAFVDLDFVGRDRAGDVKLTGAERRLLGHAVFDGVEVDLAKAHGVAVPVGFAFGKADKL